MSSEQNKAIRRQEYEAVNQKNLDALDEVITSDVTSHPARPGQAPGLEGVKQLFSSLHAAFPDFYIDVEDMIAEGDKVVARVTASGTHQGEFMRIAPTGNRVEFSAIDIACIAEGKIAEHWSNSDQLGMMRQLGVMEQPSG
jgi:predicted ester cyclase